MTLTRAIHPPSLACWC